MGDYSQIQKTPQIQILHCLVLPRGDHRNTEEIFGSPSSEIHRQGSEQKALQTSIRYVRAHTRHHLKVRSNNIRTHLNQALKHPRKPFLDPNNCATGKGLLGCSWGLSMEPGSVGLGLMTPPQSPRPIFLKKIIQDQSSGTRGRSPICHP